MTGMIRVTFTDPVVITFSLVEKLIRADSSSGRDNQGFRSDLANRREASSTTSRIRSRGNEKNTG